MFGIHGDPKNEAKEVEVHADGDTEEEALGVAVESLKLPEGQTWRYLQQFTRKEIQ